MKEQPTTPLGDAIATLESVCAAYVNWYANGRSCDAGSMAYAMVSDVRQALASLKTVAVSETAPCKRAGLSLIEDIMDDAKLLKEHAPKELHAMIDGIYYRAQNAKGSFDE